MAVPTITAVSPSVVYTGRNFVTITGTNFQIAYPPPPSNGPLPTPGPTVALSVASVTGLPKSLENIRVTSSTTVTGVVPPIDAGALTFTLQNLDSNGAPISGEVAVVAGLAQARLPDLTLRTDFERLERTLISELRRQVLKNVLKTAAVDYDGTPGGAINVPDVAELPALALQGPQVVVDRFFDLDVGLEVDEGGGVFSQHRIFRTVDLTYHFVAMDNKQGRNMALFTLMLQFIQNNTFIELQRDENDPSKGVVKYELEQVGEFITFTGSSNSDIRGFSGSFIIRGFGVEGVVGFVDQTVAERGSAVDNVVVGTQGFLP